MTQMKMVDKLGIKIPRGRASSCNKMISIMKCLLIIALGNDKYSENDSRYKTEN